MLNQNLHRPRPGLDLLVRHVISRRCRPKSPNKACRLLPHDWQVTLEARLGNHFQLRHNVSPSTRQEIRFLVDQKEPVDQAASSRILDCTWAASSGVISAML